MSNSILSRWLRFFGTTSLKGDLVQEVFGVNYFNYGHKSPHWKPHLDLFMFMLIPVRCDYLSCWWEKTFHTSFETSPHNVSQSKPIIIMPNLECRRNCIYGCKTVFSVYVGGFMFLSSYISIMVNSKTFPNTVTIGDMGVIWHCDFPFKDHVNCSILIKSVILHRKIDMSHHRPLSQIPNSPIILPII